jgi:hypothetical protein
LKKITKINIFSANNTISHDVLTTQITLNVKQSNRIKLFSLKRKLYIKNTAINGDCNTDVKGKAIPLQACTGPSGYRKLSLPEFLENRNMKVVRLSAPCTGRLYPQEILVVLTSVRRLSRPQCHSVAGKIKSIKINLDDPTGKEPATIWLVAQCRK